MEDEQDERQVSGKLRSEISSLIQELGGIGIVESQCELGEVVAEIFGRGRIAERADEFGLTAGMAYDLGTGWDLNVPQQMVQVESQIEEQKPMFLVGSPR